MVAPFWALCEKHDADERAMSVAMDGKENHHGEMVQAQHDVARQNNKPGLAQRSQNQLNQNHGQRRGRGAAKSRRRAAGYQNQKRHGMWHGHRGIWRRRGPIQRGGKAVSGSASHWRARVTSAS